MNQLRKIVRLGCAGILLISSSAGAFAPTNFFTPNDPNLRLPITSSPFRLGIQAEYGSTSSAYDWDSKKHNVLRIYDQAENIIPMLLSNQNRGAQNVDDFINANINPLNIPAITADPTSSDSSVAFDGDFKQADITIFGKYKFPQHFLEGHLHWYTYLPIRNAQVKNIRFSEITAKIPGIHDNLTKDFTTFQTALNLFMPTPLDLGSWSKTGIGDLTMLLEWFRWFKQDNSLFKSVDIYFRGGLTAPTSERRDINKAFSVALGNDGAWGIPFGIGLGLQAKYKIKLGVEADFLALCDHTDLYRLKTDINQTEHLLLQTGRATKSYGLTWTFNAYAKGVDLWQGLSLKAAYEYTKHDSDNLTQKTNDFDYSIINTANSLKEWNVHNLIFQLNWDAFRVNKKIPGSPLLSAFCKIPLNGKNIIAPYTVGGQLAFNF
jgi:hypothetical protein